ncbi:Glucose-1-phosphate cytidylyltransferase [bacterium YEK0313]|nr:Glucose-1-phosphate cytidylyltransferase [bacterium YEK0313]
MKAVILAGGFGSRLSEETTTTPKPLLEIGGYPILLHIMQIYANNGVTDFIVLAGYKGYLIKEYFIDFMNHIQDLTVELETGKITYLNGYRKRPQWTITIIDTGEATMTGGRLLRVKHLLENERHFALTYGDGVSDIDIRKLEAFHLSHNQIGTVTAVKPPGRFGALELDGTSVSQFTEKPMGDGAYINGGFFILRPAIFEYLKNGDSCVFEQEPLQQLARTNQLNAYVHDGFWQCMDTLRDKQYLDSLCRKNDAPWLLQGRVGQ